MSALPISEWVREVGPHGRIDPFAPVNLGDERADARQVLGLLSGWKRVLVSLEGVDHLGLRRTDGRRVVEIDAYGRPYVLAERLLPAVDEVDEALQAMRRPGAWALEQLQSAPDSFRVVVVRRVAQQEPHLDIATIELLPWNDILLLCEILERCLRGQDDPRPRPRLGPSFLPALSADVTASLEALQLALDEGRADDVEAAAGQVRTVVGTLPSTVPNEVVRRLRHLADQLPTYLATADDTTIPDVSSDKFEAELQAVVASWSTELLVVADGARAAGGQRQSSGRVRLTGKQRATLGDRASAKLRVAGGELRIWLSGITRLEGTYVRVGARVGEAQATFSPAGLIEAGRVRTRLPWPREELPDVLVVEVVEG